MNNKAWIIFLTLAAETLTCIFRFGFQLQSTRDTVFLSPFTFGLRIHHGYVGVILVLFAFYLGKRRWARVWIWRVGWVLIASDLIHHFLVLWPITGDPQFHLVY